MQGMLLQIRECGKAVGLAVVTDEISLVRLEASEPSCDDMICFVTYYQQVHPLFVRGKLLCDLRYTIQPHLAWTLYWWYSRCLLIPCCCDVMLLSTWNFVSRHLPCLDYYYHC